MDKKQNIRDFSEKRHQTRQKSVSPLNLVKPQQPPRASLTPKRANQDNCVQTEFVNTKNSATESEPPVPLSLFNKKDIDIVADALQGMVNSLRGLDKRDIVTPLEVQLDLKSDLSVLRVSSASEERTVKLPQKGVLQNELKITVDDNIKVFLGKNEIPSAEDPQEFQSDDNGTCADSIKLNQSLQTEVPLDLTLAHAPLMSLAVEALQKNCTSDLDVDNVLLSIRPGESKVGKNCQYDNQKTRVKCPAHTLTSMTQNNIGTTYTVSDVTGVNKAAPKRFKVSNNFASFVPCKRLTSTETQTENVSSSNIPADDKYLHLVLDLTTSEKTIVLAGSQKVGNVDSSSEFGGSWQDLVKKIEDPPSVKLQPELSTTKSEMLTWTRIDMNAGSGKYEFPSYEPEIPPNTVGEQDELKLIESDKPSPTLQKKVRTHYPEQPKFGRVVWSLSPKAMKMLDAADEHFTKVAVEEEEENNASETSEVEEITQEMAFNALWTDPYWN